MGLVRVIELEHEILAEICCLYPRHSHMACSWMAVRPALSSNRGGAFPICLPCGSDCAANLSGVAGEAQYTEKLKGRVWAYQ